jgi:altronate dehydratase
MNTVVVISANDNVATALEQIGAGEQVRAGTSTVTTIDPIPRGHKVALRAIAAGEVVVKYGSPIGTASHDIAAGAHVHTHNVASARGRGDLSSSRPSAVDSGQSPVASRPPAVVAEQAPDARLAEPVE